MILVIKTLKNRLKKRTNKFHCNIIHDSLKLRYVLNVPRVKCVIVSEFDWLNYNLNIWDKYEKGKVSRNN